MRKLALIVIIAVPLAFFSYLVFGDQDYKIQESRIFTFFDTDDDGVIDLLDNCPDTINPTQDDFDGDKLGDVCDFDDDNDGIVNAIDAFRQNPEEWDDFDFDGIGANEDTDDDNDGILDINDPSPSPVSSQLSTQHLDLIENCAIMEPGFPRQICYRDFFVSLIEKGESSADIMNLSYSFAKLDAIDDCHFTAHHIGYAAFQENPDLTENLMNAVGTCRNGIYHGILSAFFGNLKNEGKDISNSYKVACDELVNTKKFKHCIHGVGHGLVFYYEDDLKSPVDACREFPDEPFKHCIKGVMMQHSDNELTESTSYEEVIPEICSKIELTPIETETCHLQLGRVLAFKTNHDRVMGLEFCIMLEEPGPIQDCQVGVNLEIIESQVFSS